MGAVLQQFVNGNWIPLAFFSQKLRPPETKYTAFDWEFIDLYLGIRHFWYFLEGRCFTAFTDHKPLTCALSKSTEPLSARQQHQLAYISEFTTDVQHMQGKENLVADAVSRATIDKVQLGVDYMVMASAQQKDVGVQAYCQSSETHFQLKDIAFGDHGATLLCNVLSGQARPIVPSSWRRKVFDFVHNLSHPSIRSTRKVISSKFIWTGLQRQVEVWAKECFACQAAKIQTHIETPLKTFMVLSCCFNHIHVDLIGSLSPSNNSLTCSQ